MLLLIQLFRSITMQQNQRMSKEFNFDEENIRNMFRCWLYEAPDELPFEDAIKQNLNSNEIWRRAHSYKSWIDFSTVALRYVTCGTSEAEIERLISIHKRIVGGCMTNLGYETLEARLRLNKHDVEIHDSKFVT